MDKLRLVRRFYPLAAFLGGFVWDALTLGQRIRAIDFWRLGAFLLGAALLVILLAHRETQERISQFEAVNRWRRWRSFARQLPYLLLQFFFGGIFSALFILYFKSAGHIGTWLTAALLGGLLVANEFAGDRYGRRFTLTWTLLSLNAILLFNFALPHALGSLNPLWFYVSTATGVLLAHGLRQISPGRPGRILPAWGMGAVLLFAWHLDMIAPVPLVKRDLAIGQAFVQDAGGYALQVEQAPLWQFWRDQAATVHVPEGGRLYGISAIFAPLGVKATLEHRWEVHEPSGWRVAYRNRFQSSGGRERGFRGYSWVLNPQPGSWRLIVATEDGRTIGLLPVTVVRGEPLSDEIQQRLFY